MHTQPPDKTPMMLKRPPIWQKKHNKNMIPSNEIQKDLFLKFGEETAKKIIKNMEQILYNKKTIPKEILDDGSISVWVKGYTEPFIYDLENGFPDDAPFII